MDTMETVPSLLLLTPWPIYCSRNPERSETFQMSDPIIDHHHDHHHRGLTTETNLPQPENWATPGQWHCDPHDGLSRTEGELGCGHPLCFVQKRQEMSKIHFESKSDIIIGYCRRLIFTLSLSLSLSFFLSFFLFLLHKLRSTNL